MSTKTQFNTSDSTGNAEKTRYAICGVSARAMGMFMAPLVGVKGLPEYGDFSRNGNIVALLDIDNKRMARANAGLGARIPVFHADDFDRMIAETSPDVVTVCGPDYTHAEHIIRVLEHNVDVIVEKPMVIDCKQAQAVIAAEKRSTASVRVAFNYRYTQAHMKLKRLVMQGLIGRRKCRPDSLVRPIPGAQARLCRLRPTGPDTAASPSVTASCRSARRC